MFMLSSIKKYVIIAGVLAVAAFGAWKYYTYTQDQIRIYAENAAKAQQAQQATQAALNSTRADLVKVRENFDAVSADFKVSQQRVDSLEDKLAKHELGNLAQQKPVLVEKIVDNATVDVLRCIEIISGSPLTEDETNATTKSKANSSCPDIANPNYNP